MTVHTKALHDAAALLRDGWTLNPEGTATLATWLEAIAHDWDLVASQAEDPEDPTDDEGWRITDTLDSHALTITAHLTQEG